MPLALHAKVIDAGANADCVPEMLVRSEDRQDGTGETFDAADMAVGLSYGRAITDRFSVGVTGKFIQQRIWHSSAYAFALDIGTQFRTDFFGGLTIGATLYNFGTDMRMNGRDRQHERLNDHERDEVGSADNHCRADGRADPCAAAGRGGRAWTAAAAGRRRGWAVTIVQVRCGGRVGRSRGRPGFGRERDGDRNGRG